MLNKQRFLPEWLTQPMIRHNHERSEQTRFFLFYESKQNFWYGIFCRRIVDQLFHYRVNLVWVPAYMV